VAPRPARSEAAIAAAARPRGCRLRARVALGSATGGRALRAPASERIEMRSVADLVREVGRAVRGAAIEHGQFDAA
jgi:hypothetical protein